MEYGVYYSYDGDGKCQQKLQLIVSIYVCFCTLRTASTFLLCLFSLDSQIKDSVRQVGSLLAKVSGTGQVSLSQPAQRNMIQQESDAVLQPLMDFLDGSLTMFAQVCEKTILKRLLKVRLYVSNS